ncbi:unnamed protein product [Rotaria sordida]|nr:unnamed protein product [Rotaria sordida]
MTYKDGLRLIKTHAKSMQPSSNEYFDINDSTNDHEDGNTLNCNVYQLARRLRRTKPIISKFEFLPNELILNLFEYLYCDDIIYAFNNLNYCFQLLLHSYEYYHLNFDHIIMKSKFNLIENLPLNIQHVKSLTLSNNVYSCTNIEQCLLKYPIELFYIRLQSLSFIPRDTDQLLYLILLLPNFQQLKYLLVSENKFYYKSDYDTKNKIRDIILFEIKTLKYFTWDGSGYEFIGVNETLLIQKSTIEYYEFDRNTININELIESFMTDFWLIEKKWFVTCDYYMNESSLYIYTVPYMKNKLRYSTSCQRILTAKINDMSNIRQLILHEIKTKDIISNDHFTNLQSLEIWKISGDISYDQLNRYLNISSIKNIVFKTRINSNLFYDILKYNTTQISIEIGIDFWCVMELTEKQMRKICYLFSNIEQLIIKRAFKSNELISLLIRKLKHLSFLSINYSKFAASTETNNSDIRQWLIDQSRTKLNENNFICKWSEEQFDLWID